MNLLDLKKLFSNVKDKEVLEYGLSEPFSWRGSYDEVCFSVEKYVTGKQCKERIQRAYDETFCGWKGGEYGYNDTTPVNFEREDGVYSDGEYTNSMISEIASPERSMKLALLLVESKE